MSVYLNVNKIGVSADIDPLADWFVEHVKPVKLNSQQDLTNKVKDYAKNNKHIVALYCNGTWGSVVVILTKFDIIDWWCDPRVVCYGIMDDTDVKKYVDDTWKDII